MRNLIAAFSLGYGLVFAGVVYSEATREAFKLYEVTNGQKVVLQQGLRVDDCIERMFPNNRPGAGRGCVLMAPTELLSRFFFN